MSFTEIYLLSPIFKVSLEFQMVNHPIIGVNLISYKEDSLNSGAKIVSIIPGSPAHKKGLKVNDVKI